MQGTEGVRLDLHPCIAVNGSTYKYGQWL